MHLIDKHLFPKNYDFLIVNSGIDKRSSMLRSHHRKLSSAASRALSRDQKPTNISSTSSSSNTYHDGSSQAAPPAAASSHNNNDLNNSISTESPTRPTNHQPESKPRSASESIDVDVDAAVADLTSTMSTLRFVPPSVRFGRGGSRRGGLSRS